MLHLIIYLGILCLHPPGFLGRSVLKLLEKLLILGNMRKLLEKLEGTVIVGIVPDRSVSDRTW